MDGDKVREGYVEGLFERAKAVGFEVALEALGLLQAMRRTSEEQLQGKCVLPKCGKSKDTLGVHLGMQSFHCFACHRKGDVIKFVAAYKETSGKEAALWLV